MTDLNNLLSPLFLDEKEIKKLIEMLFFSYREITASPDKVLDGDIDEFLEQSLYKLNEK